MWLFIPFVAIPLIEIALFVTIGGWLTLWPTLAIVLGTAILGTALVRQQGRMAMAEIRGSLQGMRDPTQPLADGAMILVAGVLLVTPGFLTDTIGFLLLVPGIRAALMRAAGRRVRVRSVGFGASRPAARPDVIDGEFEEVVPPKRPTHPSPGGPSGWTRH